MHPQRETTLKRLMDDREMLAKRLATAVGTDASTVSRWRNGMQPGEEWRKKICKAMELSTEDLVALGWHAEEPVDA